MTTPPGKDGKSIHPLWLQPKKPVQMKFTKSAEHRQSVHLLTVQKASQKLTKFVGPGNIFVALAKKAVYGYVSIDSIAGPSEILGSCRLKQPIQDM